MLNQEVKAKWLQALRSGEYQQGSGALCRVGIEPGDDRKLYCCLGLLAHLNDALEEKALDGLTGNLFTLRPTVVSAHHLNDPKLMYYTHGLDVMWVTAPHSAREMGQTLYRRHGGKFDLFTIYLGPHATVGNALAGLNDHGVSFAEIADLIELL